MRLLITFFLLTTLATIHAQTDKSQAWKGSESEQIGSITATNPDGNLYAESAQHGPAIENPWAAYRIYFNGSHGIDVYSKKNFRPELAITRWYTRAPHSDEGYGNDFFFVGGTQGLGGVQLWDGSRPMRLQPVTRRTSTVRGGGASAHIDFLAEGLRYQDETFDLLTRLTVYDDRREASVDVFVLGPKSIPLAIGLVRHPGLAEESGPYWASTWGEHPPTRRTPEPPAMGSAVILPEDAIASRHDTEKQFTFVSHPARHLRYWITTASSIEQDDGALPDIDAFGKHVTALRDQLEAELASFATSSGKSD